MVRLFDTSSIQTLDGVTGISLRRDSATSIPSEPGTYILILEAPARRRVRSGSTRYARARARLLRLRRQRARMPAGFAGVSPITADALVPRIGTSTTCAVIRRCVRSGFSAGASRREHRWGAALECGDRIDHPAPGFWRLGLRVSLSPVSVFAAASAVDLSTAIRGFPHPEAARSPRLSGSVPSQLSTTRCASPSSAGKIGPCNWMRPASSAWYPTSCGPGTSPARKPCASRSSATTFAARHARPGRLLDLACGVGYGTRFLTDRAEQL